MSDCLHTASDLHIDGDRCPSCDREAIRKLQTERDALKAEVERLQALSCGGTHHTPPAFRGSGTPLVHRHDRDHADAYLALLAKLRDREAVAEWLYDATPVDQPGVFPTVSWDQLGDADKTLYRLSADALLAHLLPEQP